MKDFFSMKVIILTAGKAERLRPVIKNGEKFLLPLAGKPAGIRMILQYRNMGIKDFIIVTSAENDAMIQESVNAFFCHSDIRISYVVQREPKGPGDALKLCAAYMDEPVLIHLSDTIYKNVPSFTGNWIGVSAVKDYEKWCMVCVDEHKTVKEMHDKPTAPPKTNWAAIGIYFFEDYRLLQAAISEEEEITELSAVFQRFQRKKEIKIVECQEWRDLGSMDNYIDNTRLEIADCRCFNSLALTDYGSCIKRSSHQKTIDSEKNWYQGISSYPEIQRLVPQIYQYFDDGYEMEFLDYPSLAYLFVYQRILPGNWIWIINQLLKVLKNTMWIQKAPEEYAGRSYGLAKKIYSDKLYKRLNMWGNECLDYEYITINGKKYKGFPHFKEVLDERTERLAETAGQYMSVIHGDLVFSNILYAAHYGFFKLVDARGNFGQDMIFGDARYDIAKLRQCYHGLYDFIIQDCFEISRSKEEFTFRIFADMPADAAGIDKKVADYGYDIAEIEWIECLLFLSMIPIHSDRPNHQLAFFLKAILLLNGE